MAKRRKREIVLGASAATVLGVSLFLASGGGQSLLPSPPPRNAVTLDQGYSSSSSHPSANAASSPLNSANRSHNAAPTAGLAPGSAGRLSPSALQTAWLLWHVYPSPKSDYTSVYTPTTQSGSCFSASAITGRAHAWRCVAQGVTYDPCFSGPIASNQVVCPSLNVAHGLPETEPTMGVRITLQAKLGTHARGPQTPPWWIVLRDGTPCQLNPNGIWACQNGIHVQSISLTTNPWMAHTTSLGGAFKRTEAVLAADS